MKFRNLSAILAAAIMLPLLVACKEEEETTYDYLSGSISLPFPSFVNAGYSKSYSIDTLTTLNRDGDYTGIGYYFVDPLGTKDTLILDDGTVYKTVFTITVPDSLATLSASITGYAEKYYSSSAYAYFTVVSDESITGILHTEEQQQFTDPRDGKSYWIANGGGLQWLEPNLKWAGAGQPYSKAEAMTDIFGQYYSWEEAQTACPEGWRLPTDGEWVKLAIEYGAPESSREFTDIMGGAGELMADAYFNGTKMWEYWPQVSLSNKSRLAVIPTGYATFADASYSFIGVNRYASFWTSSEYSGRGVYRYFYVDKNVIFSGLGSKTGFAASVRCVK